MSNDTSSQPPNVTPPELGASPESPDLKSSGERPQGASPAATPELPPATSAPSATSQRFAAPSVTSQRFAAAASVFQRSVLPFLLPPLLLLAITAIVVALGAGLLLLGTSDLQVGPLVVAKAVVAAGLGVVVIGSSALWLATRA